MKSIREFLNAYGNLAIEVHANIDSYEYTDYDDVFATVNSDMSDEEVSAICKKVSKDYVDDCMDAWLSAEGTDCIDYRTPRIWLQVETADGEEVEYLVIDEENHCTYSKFTAIFEDEYGEGTFEMRATEHGDYYVYEDDLYKGVCYKAETFEELSRAIAESEDAKVVSIYRGNCTRWSNGEVLRYIDGCGYDTRPCRAVGEYIRYGVCFFYL